MFPRRRQDSHSFLSSSTFQYFPVIGHVQRFVFCQQEAQLIPLGLWGSKTRVLGAASVNTEGSREVCGGSSVRAVHSKKIMIKMQDCGTHPSRWVSDTTGHALATAPCAAALLLPWTVLIIDPLPKTTWSHILFSLLLPSLIFPHPPPSKNQVLCKLESWKEVQKSEFKLEGDAEDLELIYWESTFPLINILLCQLVP